MPERVRSYHIPHGDPGIEETIRRMNQLALEGGQKWEVIQAATKIARGVPWRDNRKIADRVFQWIKDECEFRNDPVGAELLQAAHVTLKRRAGDCDDMVILAGALNSALGLPTRFVTLAAEKHRPGEWSHVYYQVQVAPGKWVSYDTSIWKSTPGWEASRWSRRGYWSDGRLAKEERRGNCLSGLGACCDGCGRGGPCEGERPVRQGMGYLYNVESDLLRYDKAGDDWTQWHPRTKLNHDLIHGAGTHRDYCRLSRGLAHHLPAEGEQQGVGDVQERRLPVVPLFMGGVLTLWVLNALYPKQVERQLKRLGVNL